MVAAMREFAREGRITLSVDGPVIHAVLAAIAEPDGKGKGARRLYR